MHLVPDTVPRKMLQSALSRWPLLFAAWTILALSFAAQFYISSSQAGLVVSWRQALGGALGDWYVVAILSWPALLLARACPIRRDRWMSSTVVHLLAAIIFSGAFIVLRALIAGWQGWAGHRPVDFLP